MWSNCFFKAMEKSLTLPCDIIVYKKGKWSEMFKGHWPHFYWYDKRTKSYWHFCAKYSDEPFISQIWFEGNVKEFYFKDRSVEND